MAYKISCLLLVCSIFIHINAQPPTKWEAKALVYELGGQARGDVAVGIALSLQKAIASTKTLEQNNCCHSVAQLAFKKSKLTIQDGINQLLLYGQSNWDKLAGTDVELIKQAVAEQFQNLVNSIVEHEDKQFQACLNQ